MSNSPKLSINLLGWNHKHLLFKAISSVLKQSYQNFELLYMDNASSDGSVAFVREHFPSIPVILNNQNLGYAGGHNKFFHQVSSEFLMVLNPDVYLEPSYLTECMRAFDDEKVGAAMGKLLRPDSKRIDSTGLIINLARRGRDRGQWEEDKGQYDNKNKVFGVNGATSLFRKSALERIKVPTMNSGFEYFDEDFFAYWEDLDLSWRLNLAGYRSSFVPKAIAYHERAAGQSRGGYQNVIAFIKHHGALPLNVKRWNWKNHLFCIIKNDFGWNLAKSLPFIFTRELLMLVYMLIFETSTLAILPEFFKQLPKVWHKRRYIKKIIVPRSLV